MVFSLLFPLLVRKEEIAKALNPQWKSTNGTGVRKSFNKNMFKETSEGSTHYFGDGCGEPAHNAPTEFGQLRQYFGETSKETFSREELYEVFSTFCPLMTKEQEEMIIDGIRAYRTK